MYHKANILYRLTIGDQGSEEVARNSLEDLLKSVKKWPVKEINNIEMDSSADPKPHCASDLDISFKKLLCESESNLDPGLIHQPHNISTTTAVDKQSIRLTSYNDDFFEMVSRLQSKRLNDQRCDPIILSDLTNHSKNITRQSDIVACNPEVETHLGRGHRLSTFFGRVGKAARRQSLLMSTSFFPFTTSTPRTTQSSIKQRLPAGSSDRLRNESSATCVTASHSQSTSSDAESGNARNDDDDAFMQPNMSQTNELPEFRIPIAPPRNRVRYGAEGMLDLIASLQGRRMEEQRAHLNIQSEAIPLSISDDMKDNNESLEYSTSPPLPRHVGRSRSADAGSLYEMVIRCQRDRLEEQRSELPRTMPVEDVSQIVMSMQKGRIETQRASLS
ncbi:unnamed protein product [Onchocerca ochengi]|uniref:Uncharacterized protein n=1 Tax=Onchocerca ochengi TaxID=42157 RepID=A0A182E1J0_ONCOC|nr:unnamed protein product [Onchocerca ochengi]VDK67408.1 unnamed protein product [Onchocerca ochengi]VDK67942.1 unnamed protein product [Onchocerca ochengi]